MKESVPLATIRPSRLSSEQAADEMTLSIVINNYNYARYLKPCIDSILPQLGPDTEIVVVDDGSTDGSIDLLRAYGERIRLVTQANAGQAAAMNAGIAAARGDILMLLDADDLFRPGKVAAIRKAFARFDAGHPVCVTHRFTWINGEGRAERRVRPVLRRMLARLRHPGGLHRVMNVPRAVETMARYGYLAWPCQTRTSMLCLNRAMAERVFPLPAEGSRIRADEFVVRGCLLSGDFYCLERGLTAYRDHGGNGWLHSRQKPVEQGFHRSLAAFLGERYRNAGGVGEIDPNDAVVTYIYVREDLPMGERLRLAWRRSPRDLKSLLYLAKLIVKRLPYWLGRGAARKLTPQLRRG